MAARSGAAGSSSGALFTKDIGKETGKETGEKARGEGAARARRVTKREDRRQDEAGLFSPAGTDRIEPAGATVDEAIRTLMRDPRYWRDRGKGVSDHVVRQWRRAYPGRGRRAGGGTTALSPAIRADEVEPWSPAESHAWPNPSGDDTIHSRPAVIMPGFEWDARNGEWVSVPPGSEGHEGCADAQPHPFRHATGVGGHCWAAPAKTR
ncbi:hypothetical protein KAJ83_04605 [Marivibrio halodurans]|uniref:Uncharacterized protein n=1 Tax=Marivibrio halodurans TaxID=2039722 RepID=A0A8J7RWZ3_9PROT|nr:hypothetical protein [Marivibrio halodurans]MBP5856277.1 hypothetical protein [Marivibrio halodurans]